MSENRFLPVFIYIKIKVKNSDKYIRWKDTEKAKNRAKKYLEDINIEKERVLLWEQIQKYSCSKPKN